MTNPLLSPEGFIYLFNQAVSTKVSKNNLMTLVDSLYALSQQENPKILQDANGREIKKQMQYAGIISILLENSWNGNVVEFCCGNGELAKAISTLDKTHVTGLDSNSLLLEKLKDQESESLRFDHYDLFGIESAPANMEGVVALHSCGNLLDRVFELASDDVANKWMVCAPCCYGKINKSKQILPRSKTMTSFSETYKSVLKKAIFLEGYAQNAPNSRNDILLELYRRLVDFDRLFYLNEKGYTCNFARISPRSFLISGKERKLSPANCAIVAQKNR